MTAARVPVTTPETVLDLPLAGVVANTHSKAAGTLAERLDRGLGLRTVGDLLWHLPRRVQDRAELSDLGALTDGETVTLIGQVVSSSQRPLRNRTMMAEVVIGDGRSTLAMTWFRARGVVQRLPPGQRALFSGKVSHFKRRPQLTNPVFVTLDDDASTPGMRDVVDTAGRGTRQAQLLLARPLIPLYPATGTVQSWEVMAAVDDVLRLLDRTGLADPMSDDLRRSLAVVDLRTALRGVHQPVDRGQYGRGRTRLAFDEAMGIQLVLARRRHAARAIPGTPRPARTGALRDALDAQLPFTLTAGQREIGGVIEAELADRVPMQRLLQGEVGSGKTVVALRAMLQVVDAGGQAALLAPTSVLAAQHARSLRTMLGPLAEAGRFGGADGATTVALLTGSLPAAARRAALLDAASGAAGIVVGTHALLEERVRFADLGLVVVDEQHRFGVEQRDLLRGRTERPPHLLVMTATPIPRTVAMTVFGDLETSVLRERPGGRADVDTVVVPARNEIWLARTWRRIREEVATGRQAFVVCPRIGGDEPDDDELDPGFAPAAADGGPGDQLPSLPGEAPEETSDEPSTETAAVLDVAPMLAEGPLAGLRVAVLHGSQPAEQKDATMTSFAAGAIDVMVATTVVEVGVDVPNASVMVILDADRFGISQLHQLRGRIGRGGHPGVCLLVTSAPEGSPARERLAAVAASTDGFELAEADLRQRREGDVLGAAQSGRRRTLRLLSLEHDRELIGTARKLSAEVVDADPDLRHHQGWQRRVLELEAGDRAGYLDKS